uniref:ethanolamine kinase n=1 Tax=Phallusia mammillata TaxID=59560 RepID=A0A6F9DCW2_9ASCI|nr:ethanolamine kinase 1 [Phallusia mammillata]
MCVLKVDITINPDNALEEAYQIIKLVRKDWKKEDIKHKIFENGITNKLYGFHKCDEKNDTILVRINGSGTERFLDRSAEVKSFELLHKHKCAPNLYCIFTNGLCYEFIHGSTITRETIRFPDIYKGIAHEMARMHAIPHPEKDLPKPSTFITMRKFLSIAFPSDNGITDAMNSEKVKLEQEITELEHHLEALQSRTVFCHNDLLVHNIIHTKETGKITFIDYEYASFTYEAFDIGNHFCEFAGVEDIDFSFYPDEVLQREWLRFYVLAKQKFKHGNCCLKEDDINEQVDQLYIQANKFSLAAHLLWGIWGLLQARFSQIDFDFAGYSKLRLNEYYKRKEEFLAL